MSWKAGAPEAPLLMVNRYKTIYFLRVKVRSHLSLEITRYKKAAHSLSSSIQPVIQNASLDNLLTE